MDIVGSYRDYIQAPSPDRLDALLQVCQPTVYTIAQRVLRNDTEAQDVSQEVLLKCASSIDNVQRIESFPAWLRQMAYRTALDRVRSRQRRHQYEKNVPTRTAAPRTDPEMHVSVHEAIASLDPDVRALIVQHYFAEDSLTTMAEQRNTSREAVWQRIDRARGDIRAHLKKRGYTYTGTAIASFLSTGRASGSQLLGAASSFTGIGVAALVVISAVALYIVWPRHQDMHPDSAHSLASSATEGQLHTYDRNDARNKPARAQHSATPPSSRPSANSTPRDSSIKIALSSRLLKSMKADPLNLIDLNRTVSERQIRNRALLDALTHALFHEGPDRASMLKTLGLTLTEHEIQDVLRRFGVKTEMHIYFQKDGLFASSESQTLEERLLQSIIYTWSKRAPMKTHAWLRTYTAEQKDLWSCWRNGVESALPPEDALKILHEHDPEFNRWIATDLIKTIARSDRTRAEQLARHYHPDPDEGLFAVDSLHDPIDTYDSLLSSTQVDTTDPDFRDEYIRTVCRTLSQVAKCDLAAAQQRLEHLQRLTWTKAEIDLARASLFWVWSKTDPASALQWMKEEDVGLFGKFARRAPLDAIGKKDPELALELADLLPNERERVLARAEVAVACADTFPDHMIKIITHLPFQQSEFSLDETSDDAILRYVNKAVKRWYATQPAAARQWVVTHLNPYVREWCIAELSKNVSDDDLETALQICDTLESERLQHQVRIRALSLGADTAPQYAAELALEIPASTFARNRVRFAHQHLLFIAQELARIEPVEAAEWALQVHKKVVQELGTRLENHSTDQFRENYEQIPSDILSLLMHKIIRVGSAKDPDAMRKWLENSPIPDEGRRALESQMILRDTEE